MEWNELGIEGSWAVVPKVYGDERGSFREAFRADEFAEVVGHPFHLQQMNISVSKAGVVRGIHFAVLPESQAKFVTCVRGAVIDVVVDIRLGSPTFGKWEMVELDSRDPKAVYLSEGLGHAFISLEDDSTVAYLCSTTYHPEREFGVAPFDPALGIEWPTQDREGNPLVPILSGKDMQAPNVAEAAETGILPVYDEMVEFRKSLRE